jgi:predicted dehydrogenase
MFKVLIVGTGSIGERHLRCFQATGRAQVSIVEIDAALRETIAERYRVQRAFADLNTALADRPDVAVIATPAPLHLPIAQRLVETGTHVLIEKPLSTSLDGIARLLATVVAKGVVAGVAYVYRCHPHLKAMRAAIHSGRFGKPVELIAVSGQHFPTYRPAYRDIYYRDRATGGGAIQDALTHLVNAGEWLLGPIDRVVADAAHQVLDGVAVEDTVHLLARHGTVPASYNLNQHQAPNESTLTVVCEHGTVRWESHEHRWRWMENPGDVWRDETSGAPERDALFIAQAHAFLDALAGKSAVPCSLDDGLQTLRVNLAALASLEQGAWKTMGEASRAP